MQYDPIKRILGNVFNKSPFLRKTFYRLLDLLLLRAWHIHKQLRIFSSESSGEVKILDAGAGFGQYSFWMWKHFKDCEILAVDVKAEQVADCNHFFKRIEASEKIKFVVDDLTVFKKENYFDLVLTIDVMEHIPEDVLVFKNFHASMKKGGMLLITTPSDQGGSDAEDSSDASFIEEHVRNGYNIKEIENKLLSAGFSKVDARYTYGKPGNISWRLSMKYPILMLGKSKLFFIILPFYYLIAYPISAVLNYFDVHMHHPAGTGLMVKAWK